MIFGIVKQVSWSNSLERTDIPIHVVLHKRCDKTFDFGTWCTIVKHASSLHLEQFATASLLIAYKRRGAWFATRPTTMETKELHDVVQGRRDHYIVPAIGDFFIARHRHLVRPWAFRCWRRSSLSCSDTVDSPLVLSSVTISWSQGGATWVQSETIISGISSHEGSYLRLSLDTPTEFVSIYFIYDSMTQDIRSPYDFYEWGFWLSVSLWLSLRGKLLNLRSATGKTATFPSHSQRIVDILLINPFLLVTREHNNICA